MKHAPAIFFLCIAACGLTLAATAPTTQQQQPQQPQPSGRSSSSSRERYSDRYSILTQRNIFLKDRSRGSRSGNNNGSTTQSSSTQPSHRSPEETLLLRGIVMEQGEVRAYFEDIANSRMVRVAQGETIARGRITSIGLDAVEYETPGTGGAAGHQTVVAVGTDLTGKVSEYDIPSSAAAAAMAATSPVMPSGVEGLNPNDPNLTQEQRMKLKRMQELKPK